MLFPGDKEVGTVAAKEGTGQIGLYLATRDRVREFCKKRGYRISAMTSHVLETFMNRYERYEEEKKDEEQREKGNQQAS